MPQIIWHLSGDDKPKKNKKGKIIIHVLLEIFRYVLLLFINKYFCLIKNFIHSITF